MKLRINSINLVGAKRTVTFEPGLNIISGSITTGKSALMRCLRGLLGSGLQGFPREIRNNVSHISGEIEIGATKYKIVRPFVTTNDARVEIAGPDVSERLPALKATKTSAITYGTWLLNSLELPSLQVPKAPSRPDSEQIPLSVNDFFMYCVLDQDEIDKSVFGNDNSFKNTKRKYVFEVVYEKYDLEITVLQAQLREAYQKLRRYQSQNETIEELLEDTQFSNRAKIELQISDLQVEFQRIENGQIKIAEESISESGSLRIRNNIRQVESELNRLRSQLNSERNGLSQMQTLLGQLQVQATRLTKSIVAETYLLDFDFVVCPRCSSSVSSVRGSDETCYLCLQAPTPQLGKKEFVQEHQRLERQIEETEEIIDIHTANVSELDLDIERLQHKLQVENDALNHQTASFVSEHADRIRETAARKAELLESIRNLQGYLQLFEKQSQALKGISQLKDEISDLEARIDSTLSSSNQTNSYIKYFEKIFSEILEAINIPHFHDPGSTGIDRKTYLPIVQGRPFSEFTSPGMRVMVNFAHALAHQLTNIHFDLMLPNILIIDGLSGNLGYRDLDAARIKSIYDYLNRVANATRERLQIIVADNSIPDGFAEYVRLELSEDEKLIPKEVLGDL